MSAPAIRFWIKTTLVLASFSFWAEPLLAQNDEVAKKLATLLRSARSIISNNKALIADPTKMEFSAKEFVIKAKKSYKRAAGGALDASDAHTKNLLKAIEEVADSAKSGKFKSKWPSGKFANKFLPARFAKEVTDKFNQLSSGNAAMKLTAPPDLLVNPSNQPDSWESNVIQSKFLAGSWPKNKSFSETADSGGKSGFRYILPEYYKASCMGCHGGDEGKAIHKGKVPGKLNSIGGAISVTLF